MATIVKEPLLNCSPSRRWRRKKFIAILVFAFFLIALVSYSVSGKSSRKLHKSIHKLEDKFEDMQKEIEALKHEKKSLSQIPDKRNQNMTSAETEKVLANLQQQLKGAQEEMKEQKEAMKGLFRMFESYKEETSKQLSELKSMHINDQQEIQRLQNTIKQHESSEITKVIDNKKDFEMNKAQVQPKDSLTAPELKPKSSSNILARSAKALKDYVSNLAYKLNPFRGSRDKAPANKPLAQENKIPIALEGTIKKSLESVKSEQIQAEKYFALFTKDIDGMLENLVSLLNNAANLDDPAEILKKIESKFHHLERVIADYLSTKLNGKDQERVLKWKKNYVPVKEQFEKIMHDNMTHGSKSHKHSSKNLQKLATSTRHLKDILHSL